MNPHDNKTREETYILKKKLKNIIKKNKFNHKKSIVDKMCRDLSNGQKKTYWQHLKKLEKNVDNESYMPDQTMIDHFKETLYNVNAAIKIPDDSVGGPLDYKITIEELHLASTILKNGKSPGTDNILNEMITPLITLYPEIILKLCNDTLNSNIISPQWLTSLIFPIHKKGAKDNPDNYRGISLMSCMGKLFFSILNNRLTTFANEKNLLAESQLGFTQGTRTSDPLIILHNLIQKYCYRKKKKLYCCFVDFSKAFDNISRNILLEKIQKNGICGNFFNIIKTMYTKDTAKIKIKDKCSESFKPNKGVRQGCVLSPLLFNIYLADLQKYLDNCGDNAKIDENKEISCLIWADDILILSESEVGLQKKLDALKIYCLNNELTVNTEKTKCMIFNKTGRLIKLNFLFDNIKLEVTNKYKYLGFLVTPSGEIRSGLEDLRIRALKALMKIKNALGPLFQNNLQNSIHLYNYMVKPILLYASDFWGCLKLPKNNPIERLHNMFCKQLLGVQRHTNTTGILLELGTHPLTFYAITAAIKNLDRIRNKKCNGLLYVSIVNAHKENLIWITNIKRLLETNGMLESFLDPHHETNKYKQRIDNLFYQRIKDQFHQTSFEDINKENGKLKTYSLVKNNIGLEKYLRGVHNIQHRSAMAKLRLSNHQLHIETGRHTKTERKQRLCPFCDSIVEDEIHFLIECPIYDSLRDELLSQKILNNHLTTDLFKFQKIMTQEELKSTAKFIFEAFKIRNIRLNAIKVVEDMITTLESNEMLEHLRPTATEGYTVTKMTGLKMVLTKIHNYEIVTKNK